MINIYMPLMHADCLINHPPARATLPSEHSIAPVIWTDIFGAFSQEQKQTVAQT